MSPSTGRHRTGGPPGGAAEGSGEGLCDRPERSEGRRREHELREAKSPKGLVVRPKAKGATDPVPEARCVAICQEPPGSSRLGGSVPARAQGPARRAER
jgi:hypothetical protein